MQWVKEILYHFVTIGIYEALQIKGLQWDYITIHDCRQATKSTSLYLPSIVVMLGYEVTRLPQRHNNAIRVAILGSNIFDFAGAAVCVCVCAR